MPLRSGKDSLLIKLSDLESLRYSNHDLGQIAFITGFTVGAVAGNSSGGDSQGSDTPFTSGPPAGDLGLVVPGTLGGLTGYFIANNFNEQWQDFDFTPYKEGK